jgi:putative transposase
VAETIHRTYRYRIYPTRRQAAALESHLAFACQLYNAALEQRRDWWKRGRSISCYDQQRQLTEARHAGQAPEGMNATCQAEVLARLDRAFQAFYRRVRRGQAPGYPRFRQQSRYDSLTWRRSGKGAAVKDDRLYLQGIGHLKVRWHRELPSVDPRQTIVRRQGRKWFVLFVMEVERPAPLPATGQEVGIDLGITTFVALSDGELVEGPRAFKAARADLRRAQRRVARRRRGSHRRRKAAAQVAARHEHAREVRRDHAHKVARDLVRRFDIIHLENLNVAGLVRTFVAREVLDQGWSQFVSILRAKAGEAGREIVAVDPKGTSQRCSDCGETVLKDLSVRVHRCKCGYVADRDVNAARNILLAGRASQALTRAVLVA